jgi:hypothetical protein
MRASGVLLQVCRRGAENAVEVAPDSHCFVLGQMFLRASSFTTFHSTTSYQVAHDPTSNGKATAGQLFLSGAVTGFCLSFVEVCNDER